MIIDIPNGEKITIKYLVFDYNGTIAYDGIVISDFIERVSKLNNIEIFVTTADTYGTVREQLKDSKISLSIISKDKGSEDKEGLVKSLGAENVIAFGNGSNDRLMLKVAKIGVCIIGGEGASVKAIMASDLVVNSLDEALMLLEDPKRLIAGLRE